MSRTSMILHFLVWHTADPYELTAVVYRDRAARRVLHEIETLVCGRKSLQEALKPELEALGVPPTHVTVDCCTLQGAPATWDTPAHLLQVLPPAPTPGPACSGHSASIIMKDSH